MRKYTVCFQGIYRTSNDRFCFYPSQRTRGIQISQSLRYLINGSLIARGDAN